MEQNIYGNKQNANMLDEIARHNAFTALREQNRYVDSLEKDIYRRSEIIGRLK